MRSESVSASVDADDDRSEQITIPVVIRRAIYTLAGRLPFSLKLAANQVVNARFLVGLVGVVFDDEGRVLILEHTTYRPLTPHGLPSGWLKKGESLADALRREIAEETGFDVAFEEILATEAGEKPRRIDVWLRYRFVAGEFVPSAEVSGARFYELDDLPRLLGPQQRFLASMKVDRETEKKPISCCVSGTR
jgi:ADP-ribose pyrophosphatase YjhB (NUDIX family)